MSATTAAPTGPGHTPRTILYTGKGGVGKTSLAAATARRCAANGLRTVVLSTDPAHSLSDSLGVELGADPTPAGDLLWGQEVQAQRELEQNWSAVQNWLIGILADQGVGRIAAEELTVPPGLDELFSLLQIKAHHESGDFDAIVVDCAPTGETLRMLSFPDICHWWLERVFPWESKLAAAAAPIARNLLDVPLPEGDALAEVQNVLRNLISMNEILRDREHASIRLVLNPDRMVVREAQRTFTYLSLYGFLTDAVVVNRIFPDGAEGDYFQLWREQQAEQMETITDGFAPVPILRAPFFEQEVIGPEMLDRLGDEVFADFDPAAVLHSDLAMRLVEEDGETILRIPLPLADKRSLRLRKIGAELIVSVGSEKRLIILPSALAARAHTGASLEDGFLAVRFDTARTVEAIES